MAPAQLVASAVAPNAMPSRSFFVSTINCSRDIVSRSSSRHSSIGIPSIVVALVRARSLESGESVSGTWGH
jgi:hypothetical protein